MMIPYGWYLPSKKKKKGGEGGSAEHGRMEKRMKPTIVPALSFRVASGSQYKRHDFSAYLIHIVDTLHQNQSNMS